jgi:hypothetical protein
MAEIASPATRKNDDPQDELLERMERELMRAIPHDNPKGAILYHYTDAGGFEGIIRERAERKNKRGLEIKPRGGRRVRPGNQARPRVNSLVRRDQ